MFTNHIFTSKFRDYQVQDITVAYGKQEISLSSQGSLSSMNKSSHSKD